MPLISIAGKARERGLAHGRELQDRVRATYEFYARHVFRTGPLGEAEIHHRAEQVRTIIHDFSADLAIELDAIAEGAGLEAWQIYALNARTEILNARVPECTALYFQKSGLLGQTWDWIRELEDLVVLIRYDYPGGRRLLTLTEPGMLAKIGLNDRGLGLCLNFLVSEQELDGVPVHVLARAILETGEVGEARSVIERSGFGKSTHFLVADDKGGCCSVEFANGARYELQPRNACLVHTNHCIAGCAESLPVPSSTERLTRARECIAGIDEPGVEAMRSILLDRGDPATPINTPYHTEELLGGLEVGTCAAIMMELGRRALQIKKGPGAEGPFRQYAL